MIIYAVFTKWVTSVNIIITAKERPQIDPTENICLSCPQTIV